MQLPESALQQGTDLEAAVVSLHTQKIFPLMQAGVQATKAAPETSTTPANATGILDLSLRSLSISEQQQPDPSPNRSKPQTSIHSYSILFSFKTDFHSWKRSLCSRSAAEIL